MKLLLQIISIAIISALLQLYFPFWITAVVAFVVSALFRTKGISSFLAGFLSIGLLWFIVAYKIDMDTQAILTDKIAQLFSVSNTLLILLTAVIGALIGGFGALSGSLFIRIFGKKQKGLYR